MAIKVRQLDKNGDRTFGKGAANYVEEDIGISQNIQTRLKSLKGDFFLDTDANIDWFNILGQKSNEDIIKSEVYRVALNTDGVITVNSVSITTDEIRNATINVSVDTIYKQDLQVFFDLNLLS